MLEEKYKFTADNSFKEFSFNSQGTKGGIKKVVCYRFLEFLPDGTPVYNLGFGDWNEEKKLTDDNTRSNNGDHNKVLATVASTVIEFCERYGRVAVFASGITPGKTRLYQMGINANLAEIQKIFDVYGWLNEHWGVFESNCNYEAFLVIKK